MTGASLIASPALANDSNRNSTSSPSSSSSPSPSGSSETSPTPSSSSSSSTETSSSSSFKITQEKTFVSASTNTSFTVSGTGCSGQQATVGIALACVLLSFLMMITRSKAVPQVIAFLAMENGLFFAATSTTYGMPMVVELGIALDVMVGMVILAIFFFQIREQFDSLDIGRMEQTQKAHEK